MTTVAIAKPERSAFDTSSDKLRPFLESLSARVAAGSNWMVRKKALCDMLLALDTLFAMPAEQREALFAKLPEDGAEAEPAPDEEAVGEPGNFASVLPIYVGAILERLDEHAISSVEQAAMYLLSIHPEHQRAAEQWLTADPRNVKALRKLLRGDRRYRTLTDHINDFLAKKDAAADDLPA